MSKTLSSNVTLCNSFFKKGTGLMFKFPKKPFAYVFNFNTSKKAAITMWFVFYPIDIVFLNEYGVVVELVSSLKPFTNYFPKHSFLSFIEFPSGTISKHSLKIGSKLSWNKNSVTLS